MSRWGRRALIVAAAVGAAGACIELGGPKSGVVSISSLRIPYPTVVVGDIMRDSLGAPAPLTLTAFDASGSPMPSEPINFFVLDTTITVDPDGTVNGRYRDSVGARVVAGAGALQTGVQRIFVSVRPEAVAKSTAATEILFDISAPDTNAQTNWSPALTLTLTGAAGVGAQGFIVSYQVIRSPAPTAPGIPTAYIGDETGRTAPRDTTDQKGVAARRVILRQTAVGDPGLVGGTKTDTIIVRAAVKFLGSDVPGSPVEFIVPVKRK